MKPSSDLKKTLLTYSRNAEPREETDFGERNQFTFLIDLAEDAETPEDLARKISENFETTMLKALGTLFPLELGRLKTRAERYAHILTGKNQRQIAEIVGVSQPSIGPYIAGLMLDLAKDPEEGQKIPKTRKKIIQHAANQGLDPAKVEKTAQMINQLIPLESLAQILNGTIHEALEEGNKKRLIEKLLTQYFENTADIDRPAAKAVEIFTQIACGNEPRPLPSLNFYEGLLVATLANLKENGERITKVGHVQKHGVSTMKTKAAEEGINPLRLQKMAQIIAEEATKSPEALQEFQKGFEDPKYRPTAENIQRVLWHVLAQKFMEKTRDYLPEGRHRIREEVAGRIRLDLRHPDPVVRRHAEKTARTADLAAHIV